MADILIRGMEMPEKCDAKCPLYNTSSGYYDCVITRKPYNWGLTGRPSDCPLHELPEHGDLIDRNALTKEINERIDAAIKWGVNAIADRDAEIKLRAEQAVATFCEASLTAKKLPVIIPANKEQED